jgi:hypothetical protein
MGIPGPRGRGMNSPVGSTSRALKICQFAVEIPLEPTLTKLPWQWRKESYPLVFKE